MRPVLGDAVYCDAVPISDFGQVELLAVAIVSIPANETIDRIVAPDTSGPRIRIYQSVSFARLVFVCIPGVSQVGYAGRDDRAEQIVGSVVVPEKPVNGFR